MEQNDEMTVTEVESIGTSLAKEKAQIDQAVSTAKAYPRNMEKALSSMIFTATIDIETASICGYAVPRAGKSITGKSIHLAKICLQAWGNMRAEAKVTDISEKHITSEAVAWDLESNVAVKVTVKRSIMQNKGKDRMSQDMIGVTGNAANAIALRNAIFNVIPSVITDKVYQEAQNKIIGGDEVEIAKKLGDVLKAFKKKYGKEEADVLGLVGKSDKSEVTKDNLVVLIWIGNSIKDGDTTVEEVFKVNKEQKTALEKKEELKQKKEDAAKAETPPISTDEKGQAAMFNASKDLP